MSTLICQNRFCSGICNKYFVHFLYGKKVGELIARDQNQAAGKWRKIFAKNQEQFG
jgi:hypothetical protein